MARKMMVQLQDGSSPLLTEAPASNELQLQNIMKEHPDLLPVDEFGMTGPLLVVGRETTLPSGYIDLLCLTRGGDLLIVEFKTGPQNADFRHVLAQLLDYGSDLWGLSYEEFESTVATRYFSSNYCQNPQLKGKASLQAAAQAVWSDLSDDELAALRDRLVQQLTNGAFRYVVVAQRFTPTMERTIGYLNATMSVARFYAVELVRFAADGLSAFESRTVLRPATQSAATKQAALTNEAQLLERIEDDGYRHVIEELLHAYSGLGLSFEWGTKGTPIRLRTPDRTEPLSIAWFYPPGISGWYGLTDLTLGFDPWSAEKTPSIAAILDEYLTNVQALPGVEPVKAKGLRAYRLAPKVVAENFPQVREILAELVKKVGEVG